MRDKDSGVVLPSGLECAYMHLCIARIVWLYVSRSAPCSYLADIAQYSKLSVRSKLGKLKAFPVRLHIIEIAI